MTKPLLTDPEAAEELAEAAERYEEQRAGLGQSLLDEISISLERVRLFPQAGAPVPYVARDLSARRVTVKRFPYHVVYIETPAAITILAVAHHRRKPGYWLGRRGR